MAQENDQRTSSTPPPVVAGQGGVFPPRPGVRNSETVINVERRAALEEASELPAPSSTICRTLFPNPEAIQQALPNPSGIELGHFRIQTAIRSGGMGAVFEALDTRLNRPVALKILPPSLSRDLSSVQRFRNEAQAAAQLDHDNIARVYFIGEDKGLHFIAFEFIRGTNLREIVQQRGKLTPAEAVNYTLQVASAVAHASAHGVVHRDIKPSNVIITPSGRAKLVDLGLARSEHRENEPDLTVAGTTLGTFDYISPEQAKDPRAVDVRSDIYSLGCTLYHLLTGEPPYPQGTVLQKLLDHQGKEAPDPRAKNRRVTPELAAIVKMMMASDPRRRYQTAEVLIRDLLVVANLLGLRSVSSEGLMWLSAQNSSETFWERHASWLATVAGLLLIVGYLEFGRQRAGSQAATGTSQSPFEVGPTGPDSRVATTNTGKSATSSPSNLEKSQPANSDGQAADSENGVVPAANTAEVGTGSETLVSQGKTPDVALDPSVQAIPKSIISDSLSDPSRVFGNSSTDGSFSPTPLVSTNPRGVTYGPRELNAELMANRTSPTAGSQSATTTSADGPPKTPSVSKAPSNDNADPPSAPSEVVTTTPPEAPVTPAVDATAQAPIVLIKSDGTPKQAFPTLEAACAVAQDGNVIELQFNGSRTESPLRIRNKITIRAARSFRPVIEFAPKEIPAAGYETRMMTISGGTLDLVDVGLLLNVRAAIATDLWALISTQRTEAIRLQRVVITVQNPSERPATVIEFRGGTSRMVTDMEMMNANQMTTSTTIRLADSMVRGGTDLLLVKSFLAARIDLNNCLLALNGTLLRTQGSVDVPEKQTELTLQLNQITAAVNSGLIVMEGGEAPRKLGRVRVEAGNNIFTRVLTPDRPAAPLIFMVSHEPPDDLLKLLAWSGQKNFYHGFESYLTRTAQDGSRTTVWDYEEWKFRWDSNEVDPHSSIVLWKERWSEKPFTELTPFDFELDDSARGNPALSAANDGGNAGVDLSRLTKLNVSPPLEASNVNRLGAISP